MKKYQKIKFDMSGFLIFEALVAMAIMIIIIPAAVSLGFSNQALQNLAEDEFAAATSATDIIVNGATEQAASSSVRYSNEFGRSTCTIGSMLDFSKIKLYTNNSIDIGNGSGTSVIARNGFIYETVNSSTQSSPDFFIIDTSIPMVPKLVSSLNTGPGLADIAVAGHYVYVANESSISQLQIIDIEDRSHPVVSASLKLPLPQASTTLPHAVSISYNNGLIFLGTVKWSGNEFNIIDVTNPPSPVYLGGFDTDTIVNDVYVALPYAYVADADADQMRVLNISDPKHIDFVSGFSPAGSSVLEGKVFSVESTDTLLYFGRDGGGFDNPSYFKLSTFNLSQDPLALHPIHGIDVPGGVYGIVVSSGYVFLAVGGSSVGSIQIWKRDLSTMLYSLALPAVPVSLSCDHDRLYVGLNNRQGFAVVAVD